MTGEPVGTVGPGAARPRDAALRLLVAERTVEADGVLSLRLEDPHGAALPPWEPGAHLELRLPSGLIRHYSLCGDPADRTAYRIGVLRDPASRGGSVEVHDAARVGGTLDVRGPRNRFPLVVAPSYLFVAGGIGITPILPMLRAATAAGRPWRLLYGGRSDASMAFREELGAYPGDRVEIRPQDRFGLLDVAGAVRDAGPGAAVYCCGPEPLIAATADACAAASVADRLHLERFATAPAAGAEGARADAAADGAEADGAFQVECVRSGITLTVPEHASILDVVLEQVDDAYPYECTEGFCGTCEARVLGGEPDHRDEVLTDEERASNTSMMICVGRSRSPCLRLDI